MCMPSVNVLGNATEHCYESDAVPCKLLTTHNLVRSKTTENSFLLLGTDPSSVVAYSVDLRSSLTHTFGG